MILEEDNYGRRFQNKTTSKVVIIVFFIMVTIPFFDIFTHIKA